MSDESRRDVPLTSEEMIERARSERVGSSEELLQEAKDAVTEVPDIEGLENLEITVPVEGEFPEPLPRIQPGRPRRVHRQPPPIPQGPISSDRAPRALAAAIAVAILLLAIGVFVAAIGAGAP